MTALTKQWTESHDKAQAAKAHWNATHTDTPALCKHYSEKYRISMTEDDLALYAKNHNGVSDPALCAIELYQKKNY